MKNNAKYEKNVKREKRHRSKEGKDKDIHLNVVGVPTANVNVNKTSQGENDEQYHLYKISINAKPKGKSTHKVPLSGKPQAQTMHRRAPDTYGTDSLSSGSHLNKLSSYSPQNNKSLPPSKQKKNSEICVTLPERTNRGIRIVGNVPYNEGKIVSGTKVSKPFTAEKAKKTIPGATTGKEVLSSEMDAVYGTSTEDSNSDVPYTSTKHPVQIYQVDNQSNMFKTPPEKIDLLSDWRRLPDDYDLPGSPQQSPLSSNLGLKTTSSKVIDHLAQPDAPELIQVKPHWYSNRSQSTSSTEIKSTYPQDFAQDVQSFINYPRTLSNVDSTRPIEPGSVGGPDDSEHFKLSLSQDQENNKIHRSLVNRGTDTEYTEIQTHGSIPKLDPRKTGENSIPPFKIQVLDNLASSSTTPYSKKSCYSVSQPSGPEHPVNDTQASQPAQQTSKSSSTKKPLKIDKDIMTETPMKPIKDRSSKFGSSLLRRHFSNKFNNPSNESSKHKPTDSSTITLKSPLKTTIPKPLIKSNSLKTHDDKDSTSSTAHPTSLTTYSSRSYNTNIEENYPNFKCKTFIDGGEDYIPRLLVESKEIARPSIKKGIGTRPVSLQIPDKDRAASGITARPLHIQGREVMEQPQWRPSSERRQKEPSGIPTWPEEYSKKSVQSLDVMPQPQWRPSSEREQQELSDKPTCPEEDSRKSVQGPDVPQPQWRPSSEREQQELSDKPTWPEEDSRKSVQGTDVPQPQWRPSNERRRQESSDRPTWPEEDSKKSVQILDAMVQPLWRPSSERRQEETTTWPEEDSKKSVVPSARQLTNKESIKAPVDEKFNAIKIDRGKTSPRYYDGLSQILDKLSPRDGITAKTNNNGSQISSNQTEPKETDSSRRGSRINTPTIETIKEEEASPEEGFFGIGNLPYDNRDAIAFPGHISDQTPFAYRPDKNSLSRSSTEKESSPRSSAEYNGRRGGDYESEQPVQNKYYKPKILLTRQSKTNSNECMENTLSPPSLRRKSKGSAIVPEDSFKGKDKRKISKAIKGKTENETLFAPKEEIIYVGKLPDTTYNVFFSPDTPDLLDTNDATGTEETEEAEEETVKDMNKDEDKENRNREKPLSPVKSDKLLHQGPKGILIFVNKKNGGNKTPFDEGPQFQVEYNNKQGKKLRPSKGRRSRPRESGISVYSETKGGIGKASEDNEVRVERSPSGTKITHTYPCGCLRIITSDPGHELAEEVIISALCTKGSQCEVTHPELQKGDRVIPYYSEPTTPLKLSFHRDGFPEIELIADGIISKKPIKPKQPAPTMKGADFTGSINIRSNKFNGVCNLYLDEKLKRYLRRDIYKFGGYLEDDRIK